MKNAYPYAGGSKKIFEKYSKSRHANQIIYAGCIKSSTIYCNILLPNKIPEIIFIYNFRHFLFYAISFISKLITFAVAMHRCLASLYIGKKL